MKLQDYDWRIGQHIEITSGPFMAFKGVIYEIDRNKGVVRVKIDVFGQPTPVELPIVEIKPTGENTIN